MRNRGEVVVEHRCRAVHQPFSIWLRDTDGNVPGWAVAGDDGPGDDDVTRGDRRALGGTVAPTPAPAGPHARRRLHPEVVMPRRAPAVRPDDPRCWPLPRGRPRRGWPVNLALLGASTAAVAVGR